MLNIINPKGKSKPQWDTATHPLKWLKKKKKRISSSGENVENRDLPMLLVGITPNWKRARYSSVNEGINKPWYDPTMEYDSATKKERFTESHNVDKSQIT